MPFYQTLGKIPSKRHTIFRKEDGSLYAEELVSTHGFSSTYSNVYHCYPPTLVKEIAEPFSVEPEIAREKHLKHTSLKGFKIQPQKDYLASRVPVLVNNDLHISLAAPQTSMTDYFYKNSQADEVIFIHEGSGVLKTGYGQIEFEYGDYLVIPRGIIYQLHFDDEQNRLLIIESFSPIETPRRYRNHFGQLMEHSPFCERDIKTPKNLETHDEHGDFKIMIKKEGLIYPYIYGTHPFDFVGWDGYHFPWAFSIHNFEPITGRIHQPPPVHQTFEGAGFVICSFVPRLYDYHPESIPAPYNHSNVDSDEILYYVDGDFMSRKSVERGQITLHPAGIPHGPHPGTVEKSIGAKETKELAVMIDPFRPLKLTKAALEIEDEDYYKSWLY
ncbi:MULTISPECIES: homogentisate 1,2-dioxygenase [Weeksella]|uniref:Homogentisate 12-dioxygenase n=1 Tax=Weeksella virosa (strain ATCC 43766 / DSM 16922 / JCM 21250 / CCUG 30538 / CDC 9751 / IAM 14551 / NBRC 16016 / NCTC 11634 / CL345/78) TaxID=865938 RepID=F0NXM5_WEEVC|nr:MULTISPECIES: homogentisate 1,2-dioxygenase [Weeksella]ADX66932.1 homogentisate 12-dioxygenase [Weeksella virosa DSM 16922]MDK7375720.1 homogentisate 1,2-dioxygenase [Weeksella virosa]MDK7674919.1 homogentisate 1,2-dioxygenase [Weeksella virosa]OFM84181.1 homogentisate 1,2-dioxygenase [Weeksella sp. HMSC059D05]SUP53247.1 homogentisate 1,2-dioxygenase [Weeksella virosa]